MCRQQQTGKPADPEAEQIEAVTRDLETHVKVEHEDGPASKPQSEAKTEPHAGGTWAKIAAASRPEDDAVKQSIEA